MQEYDQVAGKLVRRLRDRALVDLLAASDLEKKADFEDKKELERLLKAIEKAKLKVEGKMAFDEEHSLYELLLSNGAGAVRGASTGRWPRRRITSGCEPWLIPSRNRTSRRLRWRATGTK